jgi:hypothetical protein
MYCHVCSVSVCIIQFIASIYTVGSKSVAMFGDFGLGGGVAPGGVGIMLSAGRVK